MKKENRNKNEPTWEDLNYLIYENAKRHLPKDLSPKEYEEEVKRLAEKYNI